MPDDQSYRTAFSRPPAHTPAADPPRAALVRADAAINRADAEAVAVAPAEVIDPKEAQRIAGRLGGKLGGRPKKGSRQAVARVCQRLVSDPAYQRVLRDRLLSGKLSPVMEAALWAYAYGRPTESLEVDARVAAVVSVVKPW